MKFVAVAPVSVQTHLHPSLESQFLQHLLCPASFSALNLGYKIMALTSSFTFLYKETCKFLAPLGESANQQCHLHCLHMSNH